MAEIEELKEYLDLTDLEQHEKNCIIAMGELIYQLGIKEGLIRGNKLVKEILK